MFMKHDPVPKILAVEFMLRGLRAAYDAALSLDEFATAERLQHLHSHYDGKRQEMNRTLTVSEEVRLELARHEATCTTSR
jgi:hypothetical protein